MKPLISVIMGSKSDWATMKKTAEVLDQFGVAYEKKVVSAHRTPDLMFKHAEEARGRGIKVIIAGAGGAAHSDQRLYRVLSGVCGAFSGICDRWTVAEEPCRLPA